MEGVTFHTKDVVPLLRERFVESRVHMDVPGRVREDRYRVHKVLQKELVDSEAMPLFAILDPETGEFLARYRLRGPSKTEWEKDFIAIFSKLPPKQRPS